MHKPAGFVPNRPVRCYTMDWRVENAMVSFFIMDSLFRLIVDNLKLIQMYAWSGFPVGRPAASSHGMYPITLH